MERLILILEITDLDLKLTKKYDANYFLIQLIIEVKKMKLNEVSKIQIRRVE